MSPRSRSRLLTFALAAAASALVLAWPAAAVVDEGKRSLRSSEPPLAAAPERPEPPTKGERAVKVALQAVGIPYRWAGESPGTGFDCSGLVRWAYGRVGVDLPHNSYALYGVGRRVSASKLAPGDVLFFEGLGHVGLYMGKGKMVHAPQTGRNVEVVQLDATNYGARLIGARRVVSA
jgi:cell wall-associated NlpC family hydrolase